MKKFILLLCIILSACSPIRVSEQAAAPAYLIPYIDPVSGNKIIRVSSDAWGDVCRHHYSKDQAWSADGSIIWLNKGCNRFIDGISYQELPELTSPSHTEARWSTVDNDWLIYTKGETLAKWNVRTKENIILRTFSGYGTVFIGPYEGNLSADSNLILLVGSSQMFVYDIRLSFKYPDRAKPSDLDWASVSALGKYIVVNGSEHTTIYDLNWKQVGSAWTNYGCPSHFDLTIDQNGDEVAVGVCKASPNAIITRRLQDGKITTIGVGASSDHTGARNILNRSVVFTSNPWYAPYKNNVLMISMTGKVTSIGYIPNLLSDYYAEPQAVGSPRGDKVIVASNWGVSSRPIAAYVIELSGIPTPTITATKTPTKTVTKTPTITLTLEPATITPIPPTRTSTTTATSIPTKTPTVTATRTPACEEFMLNGVAGYICIP